MGGHFKNFKAGSPALQLYVRQDQVRASPPDKIPGLRGGGGGEASVLGPPLSVLRAPFAVLGGVRKGARSSGHPWRLAKTAPLPTTAQGRPPVRRFLPLAQGKELKLRDGAALESPLLGSRVQPALLPLAASVSLQAGARQ